MTLVFVIIVGLLIMFVVAVLIGTSLDTAAQRAAWRRVARARRELRLIYEALGEERRRLEAERERLEQLRGGSPPLEPPDDQI